METFEEENKELKTMLKKIKQENALLKLNEYYRLANTMFKHEFFDYENGSRYEKYDYDEYEELDLNEHVIEQPSEDDGDSRCYFWSDFCEKYKKSDEINAEMCEKIQNEYLGNIVDVKDIDRKSIDTLMQTAFPEIYKSMKEECKKYGDVLFTLIKKLEQNKKNNKKYDDSDDSSESDEDN